MLFLARKILTVEYGDIMWEDILKRDISVSRRLLKDIEGELSYIIGISKRDVSYGKDTTKLEDIVKQLKLLIDESYGM